MYRRLGSGIACSLLVLGALQSEVTPAKASDDADLKLILQRLDKLEKENSALRTQIRQIEGKTVATEKRSVQAEKTAKSAEAAMASAPAGVGPVKGRILYVRECEMYGPGFFYIPGTPGCMKIGGYARLQGALGASGDGVVNGADFMASPEGRQTRTDSNDANYQARAAMSLDVRYPTEWGLLRGYVRGGFQNVTPTNSANAPVVWWDRGYAEFAGFTVGKQRSFFDMFDPVSSYTYGDPRTTGDTDLYGAIMAGYTARFGNGFSAAIALEDPGAHDRGGVANMSMSQMFLGALVTNNGLAGQGGSFTGGTFSSGTLHGFNTPDIIANARLDQAWGYIGASVAGHKVAAGYYGGANSTINGHPDDKWGYAASVAGKLYIPGMRGDSIGANFVYSKGAPGYATKGNVWQLYGSGNSAAFAWLPDGVYDNVGVASGGSSIELTTAWSINGVYQHIWSPQWMTDVYGGYTSVSFNQHATNMINQHLPTPPVGSTACGVLVLGTVQPPLNVGTGAGNSCSPDFSFWQIGTRTQYNPVQWLDLGVDVSYTRLNTAYAGPNVTLAANGARPAGSYSIDNQSVLTVLGRVQINFNPGQ